MAEHVRARSGVRVHALVVLLCLLAVQFSACTRLDVAASAGADGRRDPVTGMLQGAHAGFAVADRARALEFPRDFGPHPEFRTEWWYFTGHVLADDGRRFGFQYTVFRHAIASAAQPAERVRGPRSDWRADTAWLAHLAVTDVAGNDHLGVARIARGALGLGGAKFDGTGVLELAVDGWRMRRAQDGQFAIAAEGVDEPGLRLQLRPVSQPLLHGENGLSRKGPQAASYYFSVPRFAVQGQLRNADSGWISVRGEAWLDREWSTSALAPEQVGWDWLSLAFDDGSDLMLFRLRRQDGSPDAFDAGTLRRGSVVTRLGAQDFSMTPLQWWQDERGRRWPVRWRIEIAPARLAFDVRALVEDQLMRVGLEYWEGAVEVAQSDQQLGGRGYLELTGYATSERSAAGSE